MSYIFGTNSHGHDGTIVLSTWLQQTYQAKMSYECLSVSTAPAAPNFSSCPDRKDNSTTSCLTRLLQPSAQDKRIHTNCTEQRGNTVHEVLHFFWHQNSTCKVWAYTITSVVFIFEKIHLGAGVQGDDGFVCQQVQGE